MPTTAVSVRTIHHEKAEKILKDLSDQMNISMADYDRLELSRFRMAVMKIFDCLPGDLDWPKELFEDEKRQKVIKELTDHFDDSGICSEDQNS